MSTDDPKTPLELFPRDAPPATTRGRPRPATPTAAPDREAPLAERMRPRHLDEVIGQDHLLGAGGPLRGLLDGGQLPSLVLWGPPGSGKTTLAKLMHGALPASQFAALSAVSAGVKDVREVIANAARFPGRTLLFLDEIHRFNRAQQDALLPHVERGAITLIGATTENPSFEVVAPLLSRCRVYTLRALGKVALQTLLERALRDPDRGLGALDVGANDDALALLAEIADGDARRALLLLEVCVAWARAQGEATLRREDVAHCAGERLLRHDRDRDAHYDVVSALIKSLRASDPDAALYYAARMLEAGEDPRFVARRLVIFASEDVGNAEPQALPLALAAYQAVERIGLPEARINLAQALTFLACAPKSNASYRAMDRALESVRESGSLEVPLHLRNAPTGLMRELGYGRDYHYPHDRDDRFVAARNLPDALGDIRFYEPTTQGAEAEIATRLASLRTRRAEEES